MPPRWDTRTFERDKTGRGFVTLVSGRGGRGLDGALFIHQDAALKAAVMEAGETGEIDLEPGRRAYVVPARGVVEINGVEIAERGAAEIEGETHLSITARNKAEVVMLDLP